MIWFKKKKPQATFVEPKKCDEEPEYLYKIIQHADDKFQVLAHYGYFYGMWTHVSYFDSLDEARTRIKEYKEIEKKDREKKRHNKIMGYPKEVG